MKRAPVATRAHAVGKTMPLQLRADIQWCDCGGRAVFLDVEQDRYFCLPARSNDAFLRLAAGDATPGDSECLQNLVSRGILVEKGAPTAMAHPPVIDTPDRDLADERHSRPGPSSILNQLVSEALAARLLRTRSFSKAVGAIRRKASIDRPPPHDRDKALQVIAGAASAVSYLIGAHDRCLVRALAVHSICMRRGIRPKLVFGVIVHPFAAHCWVQYENAVLVGGFEQAQLYTPILVIE